MCLCYLFSAKTAQQLVNRKADFFTKRIDSHNESNRIDSNRELECSTRKLQTTVNFVKIIYTVADWCHSEK